VKFYVSWSIQLGKLQLKNISIRIVDMSRKEIENVLVAGVADN
jgi:hypothetical protein